MIPKIHGGGVGAMECPDIPIVVGTSKSTASSAVPFAADASPQRAQRNLVNLSVLCGEELWLLE
jgi:hypothetical protein